MEKGQQYIISCLIRQRPENRGFSLVELMVSLVIIGVLAGVAVPLYYKNVEYAIRAEGEATLGTIRTQVEIYYAEYGSYPIEDLDRIVSQDWHDIKPGEMASVNFGDSSYYYQCFDGVNYLVGLHRGDMLELHRSLNQDGVYEDWDVNVNE